MQERIDTAGSIVAWTTAKSAGARNVSIDDFLPQWERVTATKPRQTPEQMMAFMRALQSRQRKR